MSWCGQDGIRGLVPAEPARLARFETLRAGSQEHQRQEAHLRVTYDSIRSGASERVIFPFGLYASQGF